MTPMILLDKWNLTETLATLSHPERRTTPEIHTANEKENSLRKRAREEAQRRAYANAYKELQDELSMMHNNNTSVFSIE